MLKGAFKSFETYRIGTLLSGASSELANKNANGQLIHDEDIGFLLCEQNEQNMQNQ